MKPNEQQVYSTRELVSHKLCVKCDGFLFLVFYFFGGNKILNPPYCHLFNIKINYVIICNA
jgi:hypothetical protein